MIRSSTEFEKRIVSKSYLYTKNILPPAKISTFDNKIMELSVLNENENAFKDNNIFKI
jgi:hypothetical protein